MKPDSGNYFWIGERRLFEYYRIQFYKCTWSGHGFDSKSVFMALLMAGQMDKVHGTCAGRRGPCGPEGPMWAQVP